MRNTLLAFALLSTPTLAAAAEPVRDFCADRPGLATPSCTLEPGLVMAELGVADWTHDQTAGAQTDMFQTAELTVRIGLDPHTEAQIGWDGFGAVRTRDPLGIVAKTKGGGDVRLALRHNFINPDGSGTSIAVMPFVTVPVGGATFGAGDWGGGVLVPLSFSLPHGVGLSMTPEVDAAVNSGGSGRHLAYGNVVGLSFPLSSKLSLTGELSWFRDDDPNGASNATSSEISLAFMAQKQLQLDVGLNLGLGGTAPDRQLYVGIAKRF